jgi:hypothetical protein
MSAYREFWTDERQAKTGQTATIRLLSLAWTEG